jgi:hypothetical protein
MLQGQSTMNVKIMILIFFFFLSSFSLCQAAQGENLAKATIAPIAIETRANNKFNGFIGMLDFDSLQTMTVVTFRRGALGQVVCLPTIYKILEEEKKPFNAYHIKAENQYGITLSGTIDVSDKLNPRVTLVQEGGILITNISDEGRRMKKEYIPKLFIGSGE